MIMKLSATGCPLNILPEVISPPYGCNWGSIIGLTSGGHLGFPRKSPTARPRRPGSTTPFRRLGTAPYGVTANIVYPLVTDTGYVTDAVREEVDRSKELIHVAARPRSPR
jgi:3-oxoacyl-[acyl-carrier protein] reductase